MKISARTAFVILTGSIVLAYTSCKKDSSAQTVNQPVYVTNDSIKQNVSILSSSDATLQSDSVKLSQGIYEFQFNGTPTSYKAGDIIIGQDNQGFLRKVTSSTISGSSVSLQTEQATLEDLYINARISFQLGLGNTSSKSSRNAVLKETKIKYIAEGVKSTSDGMTFDFSNTIIYQQGPFTFKIADGSVTFNPSYVFNVDVSSSAINKIEFYANNASLNLSCDVNLNATQAIQLANFSKTLADIESKYLVMVYMVPVVVIVSTKLNANINADIATALDVNTGFTNNNTITIGAVYENGAWTGKYNLTSTFTAKPVILSGNVQFNQRLTITPDVSVRLYGVAGPYCIPEMYEQFNAAVASPSLNWDAMLSTGVNTTVGANVIIFGKTLTNFSKTYTVTHELWKAPAQIAKVSGDSQSGSPSKALAQPLKVKVTDNLNNALKNVIVYFNVAQGGGSANPTTIATDINGYAETIWTLGTGTQQLNAQVKKADGTDISGSPVTFTATVNEPASIEIVSGNSQTGALGQALDRPAVVMAKDASGNPFSGAKVSFTANNSGSTSQAQVTTGADGKASVTWTLGGIDSTQTLTVTAFKSDNTTPLQGSPGTFTATIYNTVTIGTQLWMAENLKTTKYNDGTPIPNVTDNTAWAALTTGAFSDYNNTPANSTIYGRLYNWYAVDNNAATKVASNGGKNVCPTGWHVPTDAEWTTLTTYLGGESVAGGKLKETGTTHWLSPNTGATNETGFTALPGGNRYGDGSFDNIGGDGNWWSSTEYSTTTPAWYRLMHYSGATVYRGYNDKQSGFSVRCVRDF